MGKTTTTITVISQPSLEQLNELNVFNWSIWQKEVSEFPWTYDEAETCYFFEGNVIVTPDGEQPVIMGKGDLVTFSAGMSCTWNIISAVRKHYKFG
ncbi:MAG: cupin domain-containing protein [Waterburya sp.]